MKGESAEKGESLWGLATEDSIVEKWNNLSVFFHSSFFRHQIKGNFVKVSWFPFDHHCCRQAVFQNLPNYCLILRTSTEQTGKKKHRANKKMFKQVLQWKAIFDIDLCGQWLKLKMEKRALHKPDWTFFLFPQLFPWSTHHFQAHILRLCRCEHFLWSQIGFSSHLTKSNRLLFTMPVQARAFVCVLELSTYWLLKSAFWLQMRTFLRSKSHFARSSQL